MKSSTAKHLFYLFVLQAIVTGCNNTPDNKNTPAIVKTKTLTDLKNDFKRSNLQAFEVDSFNWESGPDGYTETDSAIFYMVWQDGKRKFKGAGGEDRDYLLSWQSRDSNFIEFTVFTQDESDYCNNITYCIYNKAGKTVDNFVAASSCGDGGWSFTSSGKFIDKNTYEKLCIELDIAGSDTSDNTDLMEGDSTLLNLVIGTNGKVTEKEIFKKHFTSKM